MEGGIVTTSMGRGEIMERSTKPLGLPVLRTVTFFFCVKYKKQVQKYLDKVIQSHKKRKKEKDSFIYDTTVREYRCQLR
jgi:hypothetical protein